MAALCDLSQQLKARSLTLEVRVSNKAAQNLYTKFGFREVGLRRGYYTDNDEDALLMTSSEVPSPAYQEKLTRLKAEYQSRRGVVPCKVGDLTGRPARPARG